MEKNRILLLMLGALPLVCSAAVAIEELEPNADNLASCHELPEIETFSDASHYSGGQLPTDWVTVGTVIWRTANVSSLPAYAGEYYMISPESAIARDERAYTPFYNLEAGRDYTISFRSHLEGTKLSDGSWLKSTIGVTVGTEQDCDFHTAPIYSFSRNSDIGWIEESLTFTPASSGPYCFSFVIEGEPYSGFAAIDNLMITAPDIVAKPEADASIGGHFSYMDDSVIAFEAMPVRVHNLSRYAESTVMTVDGAAKVNMLPDGSADVFFDHNDNYKLEVTATNSRGSSTASQKFYVTMLNENWNNLPILAFNPEAVKYLNRGFIPVFDETDEDGLDYISGFNHYYRALAERYDLTPDGDFTVYSVGLWLTNLRYCPTNTGTEQRKLPLIVTIYGSDNEGNLDESIVFGRKVTDCKEVFGNGGIGTTVGESHFVQFEEPVVCRGTVYLTLEFDPDMIVDVDDPNVGRSYLSLGLVRNRHSRSTFYVKPHALPESASGELAGTWCPVDSLDSSLAGLGLNLQLWTSYTYAQSRLDEVSASDPDFTIADGVLIMRDTTDGEYLAIYDTSGCCVVTVRCDSPQTVIDLSGLTAGVYIVSTNRGAFKICLND